MKPRTLGGILIILLVGTWIYWPAMHGGWLWDDTVDIAQNPVIHDPSGWWKIWLAPSGWHFFPLKSTVQWAQWQLWENHTTGYHVTNIVLHLVGALLLWRLMSRLGSRYGWVGGLLFAVHPLAVESVAWIAELKNTLSFPLLMLSALAWVRYDERGRLPDYAGSLLCFVGAMLAKSSVVMFPLCLLLHQAWKYGRIRKTDWRTTAPFFVTSLALGLVTVWFEGQQNPAVQGMIPVLGSWSRFAGAGAAIGAYFLKAIVPTGLSPVYAEWSLASPSPLCFVPWVVALAGLYMAFRFWKSWGRHVGLGVGFFLLNLVPVLGLVPMAYHHIAWIADHFAYLPLAGLVGIAAGGIDWLDSHYGSMAGRIGIGAALIVAGLFTWQTHRYAGMFQSEETLWTHATEAQPSAWLAHHNLAFALARTPRAAEAVGHYQAALRLKPTDADAANNLGNLFLGMNRTSEAIAAYEQAVRIRPAYAEAYANLGNALLRAGRRSDAVTACARALQLDLGNVSANITLADLYSQNGQPEEALKHYAAALVHQPDDALLLNNLGAQQLQLGRVEDARRNFERAVALAPTYVEARVNFGYALVESGKNDDAIAQWREALRFAPETTAAHVGLGNVFVQSGRAAEAERQYRAALQRQPDDAEVRNNLAYALMQQDRIEEAISECERALQLRPDFTGARENLERLRALHR